MKPIASPFLLAAGLLFPQPSFAETLSDFLREFHADPYRAMQKLPAEVAADGTARPRGLIDEGLALRQLRFRNETRARIMEAGAPERDITEPIHGIGITEAPGNRDNLSLVVEPGPLLTTLPEIESRNLFHATLPETPWSDSYWPTYQGSTAARYAEKNFPRSKDWRVNRDYVASRPAASIYDRGSPAEIDQLSPAEKYDLALGDRALTLTRFAWDHGEKTFRRLGHVPGWFGYCHGWAAAAHLLMPYPREPVEVQAADGGRITFHPQDVQGLTSMLWAHAAPRTRFMGRRCNVVPEKNRNGRVINPECFDTNPASWHLALVNQVGAHGRSVIMDSSLDLAVWNYPVASYRYRYFQPMNWRETTSLPAARIPLADYKLDRFREFRSPAATDVVGIVMDVTFAGAVQPRHGNARSPMLKTLRFVYDLELDAAGKVIGGEWYSNAHPDFVWTFDRGARADAVTDAEAGKFFWDANLPVPPEWTALALRASRLGQPLRAFLDGLLLGH